MKLQAINSAKISSIKNTSFKGYEAQVKNDGERIIEFYAPPYDKAKYNVTLNLVPLKQDISGEWQVADDEEHSIESTLDEKGNETGKFELDSETLGAFITGHNSTTPKAFGYRFTYVSKDDINEKKNVLDPGLKTYNGDDSKGTVYNVYINKIGATKKNGPMYHMLPDSYYSPKWKENKNKLMPRNHVNMLGGNIDGMITKIREGKLDSYGLLMTTPLFGGDSISYHGYWPTNPYQISSARGDLQSFKDLNFELYKKGIQYVADGAFTSQGLESPLLQHIAKYGKNSPFIDYFKIDGNGNSATSTFKLNIPILPDTDEDLENITYKIVEKNGERYVQFYDKRLVSKEDAENHTEFIKSYDPALVEKYPNINVHDHSIIPYYFNISSEADRDNYAKIVAGQYQPVTDLGVDFANFAIVTKADARSANFWDGNLDLIKMDSSNPKVRNYLCNIANYWTKTIANTLLFETAVLNKENHKELVNIAKNNGISEKDLAEIEKNIENGEYCSEAFEKLDETDNLIEKEIAKFPVQSIEFPPEITAALASPELSGTTPEEIEGTELSAYYKNISEHVDTILKQLDSDLKEIGGESIYEDDKKTNLTMYGKVVAKMIIPDIVKYCFAFDILGEKNVEFNEKGVQIKEANVSISDVTDRAQTAENEVKGLIKHLGKSSLRGDSIMNIEKVYKEKFKNVSFNDMLLAQAIIEKAGAGLNWRYDAAKDIADLDSVRVDSVDFANAFDTAVNFWQNFTDEIKKENPNAYTIGEITCLDEFREKAEDGHYKNDALTERKFYEKTGITTGSNYSYFYSPYPEILDRSTEHGYYSGGFKKFWDLKNGYDRINNAGTLPFINNSHVFTDNHDKPRTMHGFVFDTSLLLTDVDGEDNNDGTLKNRLEELKLDLDPDDAAVTSRGLAGYDLFKRAIEDADLEDKTKETLKSSLFTLLRGDVNTSAEERKIKSKALGTRPVEVTMEFLLDGAGISNEDKRKEISDKLNGYIFKDAFDKYTTLWRMMVTGAGIPTMFNGDEYGQTGYETPTKNQDLGCRNRVMLERGEDGSMFTALYNEIVATSNLHKEKGMSALSGGTVEVSEITSEEDSESSLPNGSSMVAYKYDSNNSEVMTIMYMKDDANLDQGSPNSSFSNSATISKDSLKITNDANSAIGVMLEGKKEFKKKIYDKNTRKYVDSKETYIMEDGVLKNKDGGKVVLNNGVNIFYRVDNK